MECKKEGANSSHAVKIVYFEHTAWFETGEILVEWPKMFWVDGLDLRPQA